MARIRTVKPEFWTDEKISECSPTARLFFIGIWNFTDDYGNVEGSVKQLKAKIFPYDDFKCDGLLNELINHGLLFEYEVEGLKYLHVKGFTKHQKIDRPSKTRYPFPPAGMECQYTETQSSNTPRTLPEYSPLEGRERIGEDRNGGEGKEQPPRGAVCITTIQDLKSQMTGQMFIEQSCMAMGCDEDAFRAHLEEWINTKAATGDFIYPINKLKTYCLADFKKLRNGKPQAGSRDWDKSQIELDEIIQASKRK